MLRGRGAAPGARPDASRRRGDEALHRAAPARRPRRRPARANARRSREGPARGAARAGGRRLRAQARPRGGRARGARRLPVGARSGRGAAGRGAPRPAAADRARARLLEVDALGRHRPPVRPADPLGVREARRRDAVGGRDVVRAPFLRRRGRGSERTGLRGDAALRRGRARRGRARAHDPRGARRRSGWLPGSASRTSSALGTRTCSRAASRTRASPSSAT